jgi:UDP-glucuronate decarboxylase
MELKRQTAIVAGAAGFLGSHLCDALLARGMKVVGLDDYSTGRAENVAHLLKHPQFSVIRHDIVQPLGRLPNVDIVFNLACPASPIHYQADPIHTMLTSVVGTNNLLELAHQRGARFVLASTSEVYGDPDVHPQREDYWGNVNPTGPRACYDEGKRAAEALAFDYARLGRVDVRVARIFNTYGPRMQPNDGRVVSNFIAQALKGEPITIYGDGEQTRSLCYVSDTVRGLMRLALHGGAIQMPINIGNPDEMTVSEIAARVVALTYSTAGIVNKPLPADDPKRRRPDITLAKELLGWEPVVPLVLGLSQTIDWLAEEIDADIPEKSGRLVEWAAEPMRVG